MSSSKSSSPRRVVDRATATPPPTREQIDAAEAKAASVCPLAAQHVPGAGCIKCNGLVTAELNGRLTSPIVRAEQSAESLGPKNAGPDVCGSCEDGRAQHDVLRYHQGAQTPNPDDVGRDVHAVKGRADAGNAAAARMPDMAKHHDAPAPEPGKEQPFYGTEWAGRTAPDGTQVPQLAVCDFGYGHNAAPNAEDSKMAPVTQQ